MATRPSPDQRARLTRRFQHVLTTLGDSTARRIQPAWDALPAYDETNIPAFTNKATPFLTAAKGVAVRHAAAFYAFTAGIAPIGIPVAAVAVVPDLRDPFISVWLALKGGASYEDAVAAGTGRLDALARDLITSSSRQTGDVVVQQANLKVVGWERVPDDGACPWCLEVAPGFYHSAESADFGHERCGCTAEPIFA